LVSFEKEKSIDSKGRRRRNGKKMQILLLGGSFQMCGVAFSEESHQVLVALNGL